MQHGLIIIIMFCMKHANKCLHTMFKAFFAVILLLFTIISHHQHLFQMQQHYGYNKVMLILGTYIMFSQW